MGTELDSIKATFRGKGIQFEQKDNPDGQIAIVVGCTALIFNTAGEYLYTEDGQTGAKIPRKKQ